MPKYVVLDKKVGETPLQTVQAYKKFHPELVDVPMAYAGRLDPMASGQLLVLLGEECKKQKDYHSFDKGYRFEVLIGSSSDTGDILGLVDFMETDEIDEARLRRASNTLLGNISLPYPQFSSRTVKGKPLHLWTLEGRLNEIQIPTANTTVYDLKLVSLRTESVEVVYKNALERINSLPEVTEESKALGRDFRRPEVREAWERWLTSQKGRQAQIATFDCVASSGTYMRSLSEEIGRKLGTVGLAYSIHRFAIGTYRKLPFGLGFWTKRF